MRSEAGSPLLLVSLGLIAAAAALLVAGVFREGFAFIHLSIGASLVAALLLVVGVLLRRRSRHRW